MEREILESCRIQSINVGGYSSEGWLESSVPAFTSINPATELPLAEVVPASKENVETIISNAQKTFERWSQVPAPKRGELIRKIGVLLRKHKEIILVYI